MNLNFARELKCVACHVEQKKIPNSCTKILPIPKNVSSATCCKPTKKFSNFVHEILQIQKKVARELKNVSRTPCWSNKVSKHAREILEPKFGNSPRGSTTKNVFVARERKMFRARHDFQRNVEISCTKFFGTIIGKLCN